LESKTFALAKIELRFLGRPVSGLVSTLTELYRLSTPEGTRKMKD